MSLLLRNGRLLDPKSGVDAVVDMTVEADKIAGIEDAGSGRVGKSGTVIDASKCWIVPGLVDVHVHLREPGEEYKEDIESGSQAAAFGGFTQVVAMPNTHPVIDKAELVAYIRQRSEAVGLCRILPAAAVTVGQKGTQLAPFGELRRAGAVALTDDGRPVADAGLMRSALDYARDFDLPVLTHAEEPALSKNCHMHEGSVSTRLGIRGASRVAEDAAVARDILLAEYTGGRLHVCHVSTAAAVDLIRQAKRRGVRVTGEATPHHFILTDEAVVGYRTAAKMNPPLREEHDRLAIIEGLRDGTLAAIATDHAPHSSIEKDVPFSEAAHGVLGLQTALPLALELCRDYGFSAMEVVRLLTWGPAQALGLAGGSVEIGATADLAIINPDASWTFTADRILSKSQNSPFLNRSLTGRVETTILAGRRVFSSAQP